eukprot:m.92145 g.92145  ORF g.92145 m.92145 type:complete len:96 (+) comp18267_c0_seq3:142-429(+)
MFAIFLFFSKKKASTPPFLSQQTMSDHKAQNRGNFDRKQQGKQREQNQRPQIYHPHQRDAALDDFSVLDLSNLSKREKRVLRGKAQAQSKDQPRP